MTPPRPRRLRRDTPVMTTRTRPPTIDDAELFWDDADPDYAGWLLRYRVDGTEYSSPIDGDLDEGTESLARRVAAALDVYEAKVRVSVFRGRGHALRERVTVAAGKVLDWRAGS
jgi:hypothetical protein